MGEVHKLDAKRNSNRHVMAQTNKDLSHVKKAAVTTEQQLHDKEELLEQASFWLLLLLPSLSWVVLYIRVLAEKAVCCQKCACINMESRFGANTVLPCPQCSTRVTHDLLHSVHRLYAYA